MEKFVVGITASGVQSQIAMNIAQTAKIIQNDTELSETLQQGFSVAALAESACVSFAENKLADVEQTQAYTNIAAGVPEILAPVAQVGYGVSREASPAMNEMDAQQENISQARNILQGSKFDVVSGPRNNRTGQGDEEDGIELQSLKTPSSRLANENSVENASTANSSKIAAEKKAETDRDNELDALRHKSAQELTTEDKELLGTVKALRSSSKDGDPIRRDKLYADLVKKYDKEEDRLQTSRSRYEADTNRRSQYISSIGQAASHFAQSGPAMVAADKRRVQAEADAAKSIASYATQNQKAAVDTVQGSYQNTVQLYVEEIRSISDIARANSPV